MRQWAGQMTKISEKREANKVGLAITPAFCLERVPRLHCRIGEDWEWEERGGKAGGLPHQLGDRVNLEGQTTRICRAENQRELYKNTV